MKAREGLSAFGFVVTLLAGVTAYEVGTREEPLQSKNLEKLARITSKGGSCSGYKFKSGLTLTAAHCVDRLPEKVNHPLFGKIEVPGPKVDWSTKYTVDTYGDKKAKADTLEVLYVNDKFDFAILTDGKARLSDIDLSVFNTDHTEGELLDILAVDGVLPVSEFKRRKFEVKGIQHAIYTNRIMGRADIKGGSSGGSVVDNTGRIRGIISVGYNGDNLVGLTDAKDIVEALIEVLRKEKKA